MIRRTTATFLVDGPANQIHFTSIMLLLGVHLTNSYQVFDHEINFFKCASFQPALNIHRLPQQFNYYSMIRDCLLENKIGVIMIPTNWSSFMYTDKQSITSKFEITRIRSILLPNNLNVPVISLVVFDCKFKVMRVLYFWCFRVEIVEWMIRLACYSTR